MIGRLIALGIYVAFSISSQYSMIATVVGIVVLYMAVPWLIRATLRFTAEIVSMVTHAFILVAL